MKGISGATTLDVRLADRPVSDGEGRTWAHVDFSQGVPAGAWISLRYRTSLYDPLSRPTIRFMMDGGTRDFLMPAGLFGCGEWIGHVPSETEEILISAAMTEGRFGLDLTSCRTMTRGSLIARGLSRNRSATVLAMWLRLTGARHEARDQLRLAVGSMSLKAYHEWRAASVRGLDLAGLEAPRSGWHSGPHIRLVVEAPSEGLGKVAEETIESLDRQCYPNWSLALVAPSPRAWLGEAAAALEAAGKLLYVDGNRKAADLWEDLKEDDIVAPLALGDLIPPYAFAALAEYAMSHADARLIYADEESIDEHGRYVEPELKPDWSPVFQVGRPYVGHALYFRVSALLRLPNLQVGDLGWADRLWEASSAGAEVVGHVRRVLLTKTTKKHLRTGCKIAIGPIPTGAVDPFATVIIPTRDRVDLLGACLSSLAVSQPSNFEVLLVDNGSQEAETLALYKSMEADPRVRIMTAPGPFNFSELCNRAATIARGPILVFLNNDTVALQAGWLANLSGWAARPEVGAVGAKLLYPSGRLQHRGIVIGMGGYAGHVDSGARPNDPAYLGRIDVPHEVSAVTGACLAVEKAKFESVGGFDAERFPVELGDVDLCLRLDALGWKTIVTPGATLVHRESATRGRTVRSEGRYEHEYRQFLLRWGSRLEDDPFFHPALSLNSFHPMLDR